MTTPRDIAPPPDLPAKLSAALWKIRVGDYAGADAVLQSIRRYLPAKPAELSPTPDVNEYHGLRLATLLAEVADYKGDYYASEVALRSYGRIVDELQALREPDSLQFRDSQDHRWLLFRQKLYYLWQTSVLSYRRGAIRRSAKLLDLAVHLAERLAPRSEALLTQLYYSVGKVAFHERRDEDASKMYRMSLTSASRRLDIARSKPGFKHAEVDAARHSVAKTISLGLGQCLRAQGRLNEAHTQVTTGLLLMDLGTDTELSHYARLLLGSIERSIAGERRSDLLQSAGQHITVCAEYFTDRSKEIGYRTRLELALVAMQQDRLDDAQRMLEVLLNSVSDAKWIAECNLALSRVARRANRYGDAVELARTSVMASKDLERIRRRAQVALVLALYAAATGGGQIHDDLLQETLREINSTLSSVSRSDVRTHASMVLTKARVLMAKGLIADALDTYRTYETIEPFVEVGRIRELAEVVKSELAPMNAFRCPADLDPPDFNLNENIQALRRYVIQKVTRTFPTRTEQAIALNVNRTTLYTETNKPKRR